MKNLNNVALGLGVAVLGFAVYQYMRSSSAAATQASGATGSAGNAGALWQNLTFPLGTATGGTNSVGMSNVYSSTAYNPDAISAALATDSQNALDAIYHVPLLNQWGFTMPAGGAS